MATVTEHMEIHTVTGGGGLRLHVREWGDPAGPCLTAGSTKSIAAMPSCPCTRT